MKFFFTFSSLLILSLPIAFIGCKVHQSKLIPIPKTECDSLFFDLDEGKINGVSPSLSQSEIKEWFPCYTNVIPDGSSQDCGGGVLYRNHDFYYYTYFDYVEVRTKFKGKMTNDLLGKSREEVRKLLGEPFDTKGKEGFSDTDLFSKEYGCLRVSYSLNMVSSVAAHYNDCDVVILCY
jgi:hypothetical protein